MKNLLKVNLSKQQWNSVIGQSPLEGSFWLSGEQNGKTVLRWGGIIVIMYSWKAHANTETLYSMWWCFCNYVLWMGDRYSQNA